MDTSKNKQKMGTNIKKSIYHKYYLFLNILQKNLLITDGYIKIFVDYPHTTKFLIFCHPPAYR